jgi:hypothetical protein
MRGCVHVPRGYAYSLKVAVRVKGFEWCTKKGKGQAVAEAVTPSVINAIRGDPGAKRLWVMRVSKSEQNGVIAQGAARSVAYR